MTKKNKTSSNSMWGGRFEVSPSQIMQEINQSISFDKKLYKQDIKGSKAHAKMLSAVGILTKDEAKKITEGLNKIEKEIESGKFNFKIELEDIHMNIESRLKEIIGDVAGKLHTARSRNDQVATDFRLFVRDEIDEIKMLLIHLEKNLIKKSEENLDVIMPGFTHLQVGQPVLFSHHLLAYFEMFKRDISRLDDLRKRMNECPLGACAMAGTSFPINRNLTAKELGFDRPTANSMDTVSDRDFAIEFLFCTSLIATHLSRIAEEIVIWMSKGFEFIKLSDAFTSGSSIMPQKKNPDAAELIRAKTGRIFGSLFSLLTVIKGLTLTYSKDMQEDKEPVFDACANIKLCLHAMSGMILDMKVNKANMLKMAGSAYSTATDLADFLVKNLKMPFRDAHHVTGTIVKIAENKGVDLHQLKLEEMQKVEKRITKEIYKVLTVENSVMSRTSIGGTSKIRVKEEITKAKKFLYQINYL
ncbi:MAG: argininosuccinate lyase [Rickettsiales bacterium]|nr:argininosuccinate lyase [Rickettsiales bacterium]